jgi:hypothetical protein
MPKRILILHAKNSSDRARVFQKNLEDRGFTADCVGNFDPSQFDNNYDLLRQNIKDWDAILILVSKDIFTSCILSFGIGYALGMGKPLISVVKESDEVILPSWYSNLFTSGFYNVDEIWSKLKT